MSKDRKIILFSFATLDLKKSIERLKSQAINSNYYDVIKILTPNDFSNNERNKIQNLLQNGKKRGYGYWFWKPLLVSKIMNEIKDGDIVHYLDIGFHINKTKSNRFYEYLDLLKDPKKWLLAFQYYEKNDKFLDTINFPKRDEFMYTKGDVFEHFKCLYDKEITHKPQFSAGNFFIKKHSLAEHFLKNWIDIFEKKFDLIDDTPSKIKNFSGFVENRHDQSVFSILCKSNLIESLSAYEFDWAEKNNLRTWEHIIDYPFWAKRDLKYNFFKRFFNRQIKNFRRKKKKIFGG